jgi:hypothetical protein
MIDKIIIKPKILDNTVLERNENGEFEEYSEFVNPTILNYNLDLFKPMNNKEGKLVRFGKIIGYKISEMPRAYVGDKKVHVLRKEQIPQDLLKKGEEVFVIEEIRIRLGFNYKEIKKIIAENIEVFAKSPLSSSKIKGIAYLIKEEDKEYFRKEDYDYIVETDNNKTLIFKKF